MERLEFWSGWSQLRHPGFCLKVCLRLATKNPPIKSAILSLKGQTCCLQQNQQWEEDLSVHNKCSMKHWVLTLFTLLYTCPQANRVDFTSIHSLWYLGLQHVDSVYPWISQAIFFIFLQWFQWHLEHGGSHKPTWMPAWNSLDRMGPGSCQLCQQCDALNAVTYGNCHWTAIKQSFSLIKYCISYVLKPCTNILIYHHLVSFSSWSNEQVSFSHHWPHGLSAPRALPRILLDLKVSVTASVAWAPQYLTHVRTIAWCFHRPHWPHHQKIFIKACFETEKNKHNDMII